MPQYTEQAFFIDANYNELFNDKALAIYQKPEFRQSIAAYIESLGALLASSSVLSRRFTDRSAEALSKAFSGNNLFEAQHKIQLRDGTTVDSLDEWKRIIENRLQILYQTP